MSIDFQEHIATMTQQPPSDITEGKPVLTYLLAAVLPALQQDPTIKAVERGRLKALEADLQMRQSFGLDKYGSILYSSNGRDPLIDLYQELLDAIFYTSQAILENRLGDDSKEFFTPVLAHLIMFAASTKGALEPHKIEEIELFSVKRIK